jgi:adenylate kinase
MDIVLLGAPGSGKGTQAERLHAHLGLTHVASGDLFRSQIDRQTPIGLRAQAYLRRGDLVPDDLTIALIRDRLSWPDAGAGTIVDGFPRTVAQAEALDRLMDEIGRTLSAVLCIDVPDAVIVERLSGRLVCAECHATFHVTARPFRACPTGGCTGERLRRRDDDAPAIVRARLAAYHARTEPLLDYYSARRLLTVVPGDLPVPEITARLIETVRRRAGQRVMT